MQKIIISSLNQIGRNIFKKIITQNIPNLKIIAAGFDGDIQTDLIRLLKFDNTYGRWEINDINLIKQGTKHYLLINKQKIEIFKISKSLSYYNKFSHRIIIETRKDIPNNIQKNIKSSTCSIYLANNLSILKTKLPNLLNCGTSESLFQNEFLNVLESYQPEGIIISETASKSRGSNLNLISEEEISENNNIYNKKFDNINIMIAPTAHICVFSISIKLGITTNRDKIIKTLTKSESIKLSNVQVSGKIIDNPTPIIINEDSIQLFESGLLRMQAWHDNIASYAQHVINCIYNKKTINKKHRITNIINSKKEFTQSISKNIKISNNKNANIAINGAGRIAMSIIRLLSQSNNLKLKTIAYHNTDSLIERLGWDSIFGYFKGSLKKISENEIIINNQIIKIVASAETSNDICKLPWGKEKIDLVFDTTGVFKNYNELENHIKAGAKKVILSCPFKDEDDKIQSLSIINGLNNHIAKNEKIISASSCTTNALAPVIKIINDKLTILSTSFTTIHSVTASQKVIDQRSKKHERGRSSINTILTTTGAAKSIAYIMPELKNKICGDSLRVNSIDGSIVIANLIINGHISPDTINQLLWESSENEYRDIIHYSNNIGSVKEIIGTSAAGIISGNSTQTIKLKNNKTMVKVEIFYDNEYGYANQLTRLANSII